MKLSLLKISLPLVFLLILIVCLPDLIYSFQPPPPNLPSKPTQNPIDGGLAILGAAGGLYAIKKFRDRQKDDPTL